MNRHKFIYTSTTIAIGAGIITTYGSKQALGATFNITDSVTIPEEITNPEININIENIELRTKNINIESNATIILKAGLKNESTLESVDSTSIEIMESTGKTYVEDILLNISTENTGLDIGDELEGKNAGDSLEIVLKLDIEHPSTETISTDRKNINIEITDEDGDEDGDEEPNDEDAILLPNPDDIENHFTGAKNDWIIKEKQIEPTGTNYYLTDDSEEAGLITSTSGLSEYPQRGDTFSGYFKEKDDNAFHYLQFGIQNDESKFYSILITTEQQPLIVKDNDFIIKDNQEVEDAPIDLWYEWEVTWGVEEIIYRIYSIDQSSGEREEKIAELSTTNTDYDEGSIGIYSNGSGKVHHSKWNVIESTD